MLKLIEEICAVFFFEDTLILILPEIPLSTPSITSSSTSTRTLESAGIVISLSAVTPSTLIV